MDEGTLAQLQSWIGNSQTQHSDLPSFPAQALAGAIDSKLSPGAGSPLPLPWQWLYFLDPTRREGTGDDGHPQKGGFLPPVPLPRRMWAAGAMTINQPLILGEPTDKTTTITSVEAKTGRSGPLVFVNLQHEFSQGGALCISEEQNLVYREAPAERTPLPPGESPKADAEFTREIDPDPVLLFRYSALTYNAHRIHYDRDYAVNTELYPALVVHGPLLATLLPQLAGHRFPGLQINTYKFKAVRPTFDNRPFTLCGKRSDHQLDLWSVDHDGFICMQAAATIASG